MDIAAVAVGRRPDGQPECFVVGCLKMAEPRISQPMEMKVNPRKWTTKVNVAIVIAVSAVFIGGLIYGIYAILNTQEVQQDVHEDVVAPDAPQR